MPLSLTITFAFLLGAVVGSFLNVVILRLPEGRTSVVFPASHCPSCKTPLAWYDNIPLLSFLLLGRRCRTCKVTISWQYPLVELTMALLSAALILRFPAPLPYAGFFLFSSALLAIMVIDAKHQIIPDSISIPGIFAGFAFSFVNPSINWHDSGLGILLGGGSLFLITWIYYLATKRVGMGGGDIKLLAMIGAFLGWRSLFFVIFSSSLLGTIVGLGAMIKQKKGGQTVIPFGPFLAAGALLYLFFAPEIDSLMQAFFLPK